MGDNRNVMIFKDRFFLACWHSGVGVDEIARIYGVSRPAVYRAAERFGLPKRGETHPRPDPSEHTPPGKLDAALVWTSGKWAKLQIVADLHGLTPTQVQQKYHRVRTVCRLAERMHACAAD